jgi:AcrR family transcriptional regulator
MSPADRLPSKHEENSAATRARLIELGVERFPLKGYSATSIRDLLRDSGLAIGAFYYHFASKGDFFLAILDHLSGERGAFRRLARGGIPASLEEAFTAVMGPDVIDPGRSAMTLVIADFALVHRGQPEILERIAESRRSYVADVAEFVAVLQSAGLARIDVPAGELASMAIATIEGHAMHWEIYGEGWDTVAEAAIRVVRP